MPHCWPEPKNAAPGAELGVKMEGGTEGYGRTKNGGCAWNRTPAVHLFLNSTKLFTKRRTEHKSTLCGYYARTPQFYYRNIKATDNKITWFATLGDEGWHNYHHVFPWDYKPSEWWGYNNGVGTVFIELCAQLGLAHDLKTTSPEVSVKRRQRTGDLSCHVWGWYDESMNPEDKKLTTIQYAEKCS